MSISSIRWKKEMNKKIPALFVGLCLMVLCILFCNLEGVFAAADGHWEKSEAGIRYLLEDGTYVKVIFYYDYYYINVYNFDTDVEEDRNYREHKTYYVDEFTDSYWKLKDFIEGE